MNRAKASACVGLIIAALGAAAWIVGLESVLRTMDDGNGANIGAGALVLAGRGLVVVGVVVAVVFAIIGALRK